MKAVRHWLEAILVRGLIGLFGSLPLDRASALGGWLARCVGPLTPSHRVARGNLARAMPELTPPQTRRILRDMWDNLGRTIAEYPHLAQIGAERIQCDALDMVETLRTDGQPGILFSGHLANWEVLPVLSARYGLPLTGIYRAPNNPRVDRLLTRLRAPTGGSLVPKGAAGARATLKILAQGGHLGLLVDQKMNDGIEVPFFGIPAMTPSAMATFALKYRCPVVPAQPVRLKGAWFKVVVHPALEIPDTGDRSADQLAIMGEVNRLLEVWIRENPAQWLWIHRRWPK